MGFFGDLDLANKVTQLPEGNRKQPTRRQLKKVLSYHLTSPKSMQFIKEADDRAKIKQEKDRKSELVKKEAANLFLCSSMEKQNKNKNKNKKIGTCLTMVTRLTFWVM